jgi:N-acetylated-alpha-linked acidic dipeptidase
VKRTARLLGVVTGIGFVVLPTAAAAARPIDGFTADHSREQRSVEKRFQRTVRPDVAGDISQTLSSHPQLIATPGNRRSFDWSVARLRSYGLDVGSSSYRVYISTPKHIQVTMTKPTFRNLRVKEHRFPWQQSFDQVVDGYNAYSPSGDVTAQVVYANYGLPDDYAKLEQAGVDVRGKVVIVRYGNSFRGVKAKVAEEHGAKGLIIYSDPEDDGYVMGPVYPDGPWRPADGIQRGSIEYIFNYPGDPLTPGTPATPGTERISPEDAQNLPRIPTTPISYGEARPLLEALGGPVAPEDFQGGLPFPYHVGPGPTEARLNLAIDYSQEPVRDVLVKIPGAKHPEQKVVVGAHFDAWAYGTQDNTSAWAAVMEIARGLARLTHRGWRPDRTIVLAGWDGEEYGLLGSTEWVEQFQRRLRRGAVGYINMDGVGGKNFSADAVPSVDNLITDVAKRVDDPGAPGSVFDSWTAGGKPARVGRLGSGSDYTAFLDHVGVPSMAVGFSTPSGEYHSSIDDTYQMTHFLDPGYLHHAAAARVSGLLALRLADADALPFRYSDYAREVEGYVTELQTQAGGLVDLAPLAQQARAWQQAAAGLEQRAASLLGHRSLTRGDRARLRRINRALRRQERLLTQPEGLPGRTWFKHMIYAPGRLTGYAAVFLPALADTIEDGDGATAERYRDLVLASLRAATNVARRAAGGPAMARASARVHRPQRIRRPRLDTLGRP